MSKNYSEELIGIKIKVVQARNKRLEGVEGRIIDETKNTLRIITDEQKEKTLLKQGAVFLVNKQKITGADILCRPEERIKLRK